METYEKYLNETKNPNDDVVSLMKSMISYIDDAQKAYDNNNTTLMIQILNNSSKIMKDIQTKIKKGK